MENLKSYDKIECYSCTKENKATAKYCPQCGKSLEKLDQQRDDNVRVDNNFNASNFVTGNKSKLIRSV